MAVLSQKTLLKRSVTCGVRNISGTSIMTFFSAAYGLLRGPDIYFGLSGTRGPEKQKSRVFI